MADLGPDRGARSSSLMPFSERGPVQIRIVDEMVVVRGPLVSTTITLVLSFVETCERRGFLEIGLDLDGVTLVDYAAIAALAAAQQRVNRAGRQLRIWSSDCALRVALTGCHLDA